MIKYFEELQYTDEFRNQKGALLENWCLKLIEEHGFQVEKLILKNKNVEPNENYWNMKEQVKSFNKEPSFKYTFTTCLEFIWKRRKL